MVISNLGSNCQLASSSATSGQMIGIMYRRQSAFTVSLLTLAFVRDNVQGCMDFQTKLLWLFVYSYVVFITLSFITITLVAAACGLEALQFTGKNDWLMELSFLRIRC